MTLQDALSTKAHKEFALKHSFEQATNYKDTWVCYYRHSAGLYSSLSFLEKMDGEVVGQELSVYRPSLKDCERASKFRINDRIERNEREYLRMERDYEHE